MLLVQQDRGQAPDKWRRLQKSAHDFWLTLPIDIEGTIILVRDGVRI